MFWQMVKGALIRQRKRFFLIALTAALAVAGFIEAFVTPARMPWSIKLVVGVLAVTVLWVYTLMLGGRAASVGRTGDLTEDEAGGVLAEAG